MGNGKFGVIQKLKMTSTKSMQMQGDMAGIVVKAEDSCAKGPRFDSLPRKSPKTGGQRTIKNQPEMRSKVVKTL